MNATELLRAGGWRQVPSVGGSVDWQHTGRHGTTRFELGAAMLDELERVSRKLAVCQSAMVSVTAEMQERLIAERTDHAKTTEGLRICGEAFVAQQAITARLQAELDQALALLREAAPALLEGAKELRKVVERAQPDAPTPATGEQRRLRRIAEIARSPRLDNAQQEFLNIFALAVDTSAQPAAPQPSADLDDRDTFLSGHVAALKLRAESVEAQLAAVRKVREHILDLAVEFRRNPQVHATYAECASRIDGALTPELAGRGRSAMADPKAPEMPEGWSSIGGDERAPLSFVCRRNWFVISLQRISDLLSAHGLHIVSEEDVRALANYRDILRAEYAAAAAKISRQGSKRDEQ